MKKWWYVLQSKELGTVIPLPQNITPILPSPSLSPSPRHSHPTPFPTSPTPPPSSRAAAPSVPTRI